MINVKKKVLLIIPAYNESESIIGTIESVLDYREKGNLPYQLDYLVINDGSTDNSRELLESYGANVVHLFLNLGIGGAVQSGYRYARYHEYDVAVQFDGDGQHDIESLNSIVEPILNNEADFVIGSRFVDKSSSEFQSSIFRRIGIKIISLVIRFVTRETILDTTSGFRAANKKVIRELSHQYPVSYPEPESIVTLIKKGFNLKEVPVKMFERDAGESSITPLKSGKYMLEVVTSVLISGLSRKVRKHEI
jgi:glycosyltransferase involved in cell wall biosynthesis